MALTDFKALYFNKQSKSFGQRPSTEQDEREKGLMRLGSEMSFLKLALSLPGVCSRPGTKHLKPCLTHLDVLKGFDPHQLFLLWAVAWHWQDVMDVVEELLLEFEIKI